MGILELSRGAAAAFSAAIRGDSWSNPLTGIGGVKTQSTAFSGGLLLAPKTLEQLYIHDDMSGRIVDAVVEHALMLGFEVSDDDGALGKALRKWDVIDRVHLAASYGRLMGGAAILVGSAESRMDTLRPEVVTPGMVTYLAVVDRRDLEAETYYEDPSSPHFGEAEVYRLRRNRQVAEVRVHESWLIPFGGRRVSDRARALNHGWDHSVLQPVQDALRDFHGNWGAVTHLFQDLTQPVYGIKDLAEKLAAGGQDAIASRMGVVEATRSLARAVLVDADEESFTQVGAANVGGVASLTETNWQRLSAAAQMPTTILMGMSPSGMNATGESDMRSWFNTVQAYREKSLTPRLRDLVAILAASEGIALEDEPVIQWPSLWQMAPTEQAEYEKAIAEKDAILIELGILTPEMVGEARYSMGKFSAETASVYRDREAQALVSEEEILAMGAEPEPAAPSLGGAPAATMQHIVEAVAAGDIPRESGIAILMVAFALSRADAEMIVGPENFEATKPAPPPAFGAPPAPVAPEEVDDGASEDETSDADPDEDAGA